LLFSGTNGKAEEEVARPHKFPGKPLRIRPGETYGPWRETAADRLVCQTSTFVPRGAMVFEREVMHHKEESA